MRSTDVSVCLVGDVRVEHANPEEAFALCAPALQEADLLFGNLETIITDVWEPAEVADAKLVDTRERMLPGYVAAGFSVLNLANNPSMRLGRTAFARCLELLEGQGIAHVGGGRNQEEAWRPAILERKGTRVAFLGYACVADPAHTATRDRSGVARVDIDTAYRLPRRFFEAPGSPPIIITTPRPESLAAVEQSIRSAREQADVVVVSWHWGRSPATGGQGELIGYEPGLARHCIDAGADLVVGHHPHLLQGIDTYKGKAIFYCLGDFTPGDPQQATLMARLCIRDQQVLQVSFTPAVINDTGQPILLTARESLEAMEHMERMSQQFGTRFWMEGDEVVVETTAGLPT